MFWGPWKLVCERVPSFMNVNSDVFSPLATKVVNKVKCRYEYMVKFLPFLIPQTGLTDGVASIRTYRNAWFYNTHLNHRYTLRHGRRSFLGTNAVQ